MSIGARWHAHVWVLFALIAPFIAGQATQNGCNANGPRVPCGKCDIKILGWGCSFSRNSCCKGAWSWVDTL